MQDCAGLSHFGASKLTTNKHLRLKGALVIGPALRRGVLSGSDVMDVMDNCALMRATRNTPVGTQAKASRAKASDTQPFREFC
tara:strand:+ start:2099 stop:2347 length:249 start_codon:yes stop_codon:yes gene_type:complete